MSNVEFVERKESLLSESESSSSALESSNSRNEEVASRRDLKLEWFLGFEGVARSRVVSIVSIVVEIEAEESITSISVPPIVVEDIVSMRIDDCVR